MRRTLVALAALVSLALGPAQAEAYVRDGYASLIICEPPPPAGSTFLYIAPGDCTTTYDWDVDPQYDGPTYATETEAAAADPPPPAPVTTALPTWRNLYDWPNGHGYVGWHEATSSPGLYGMQPALGGNHGLWLWPLGGDYTDGSFAEWTYTAPGTTRIQKVSLNFAYRNKLLAHHCLVVGLRTDAGVVTQNEWCTPVTPPDSQRDVSVTLVDPSTNPTSKVLFFRIRMDCKNTPGCTKHVPILDPLQTAGTARLKFVDMTLVDDDLPQVSASNDFTTQTYIAGRETFALTISSRDAGSGVSRAWAERIGGGIIVSRDAPCDPTHHTPELDARICPETFTYETAVGTSDLPEGRNDFVPKAEDVAHNQGTGREWSVLVDRTGPNAVTGTGVDGYDAGTRTATIGWDTGDDPPLPTGEDGSGIDKVEFRYQVNGGAWTAWTDPDAGDGSETLTPGFDVANIAPGDVIGVEVHETDAVANTGPTTAASLTVVGDEPSFRNLPDDEGGPVFANDPSTIPNPDPMFAQPARAAENNLDEDYDSIDFSDVGTFLGVARRQAVAAEVSGEFDADNPCGLGAETRRSTGSTSTGVSWSDYVNCIVFFNGDGNWTIYKTCIQQVQATQRRGVGPGYIATMRDRIGLVVNDFRWRQASQDAGFWHIGNMGATSGGLGNFEVQYARGVPGKSWTQPGVHDYVTGQDLPEPDASRPTMGIISERMCAAQNEDYGVVGWSLHKPTVSRRDNTIRYQAEVWLKDPWSSDGPSGHANALIRVAHRYKFSAAAVEAIHDITTYGSAPNAASRVPQAKEPKFGASLRAPGRFNEIRVLSGANKTVGLSVRGQEEKPKAVLYTRQAGNATRLRVRWGCTNATACTSTSSLSNPCVRGCFNVIAKARAVSSVADPFRASTSLWENAPGSRPRGMDGWARKSAGRAKAYVRDTTGDGVVTSCSAANAKGALLATKKRKDFSSDAAYFTYLSRLSEKSHVGMQTVRRWELVGWKSGVSGAGDHPDATYTGSGVLFNAWEGARGPYDCEPLQVRLGTSAETYSTYAKYWVSNG